MYYEIVHSSKSDCTEAFPDLLRFYFEDADAFFDMDRGFEFMDKALSELFPELEKHGGTRFVDMLVKAFLKPLPTKLHFTITTYRYTNSVIVIPILD